MDQKVFNTIVLVDADRVYTKSDAVLEIADKLRDPFPVLANLAKARLSCILLLLGLLVCDGAIYHRERWLSPSLSLTHAIPLSPPPPFHTHSWSHTRRATGRTSW